MKIDSKLSTKETAVHERWRKFSFASGYRVNMRFMTASGKSVTLCNERPRMRWFSAGIRPDEGRQMSTVAHVVLPGEVVSFLSTTLDTGHESVR